MGGLFAIVGLHSLVQLMSNYKPLHKRVPELKEAIVIGHSYSHCGNCGKGASPHDKCHDEVIGYFAHNLPDDDPQRVGCGIEYKYVTSDYIGSNQKQVCMQIRPDLEWIDMYPDSPARRG